MFACMGYVNKDIWISNSSRRDWAPETSETESRAGDYGCPFSTNDLKRQDITTFIGAHLSLKLSTDIGFIWQHGQGGGHANLLNFWTFGFSFLYGIILELDVLYRIIA